VEKAEPKCECGAMGKFWHCMQGEVAAAGATFTSGKSAKLCASLDHLEKRHVRGKFGWKSSSVRARGISANSSSTLPALGSSQPLDAFTFSLHPHSTIPPHHLQPTATLVAPIAPLSTNPCATEFCMNLDKCQ
jgi:hypothetical protein